MEIKNRLKVIRKANNLTLDDIAKETGIKRGTYNNYENSKTNPSPETWQKLSNYFGLSVPYLQGYNPEAKDIFNVFSLRVKNFIKRYNRYILDNNLSLGPLNRHIFLDWLKGDSKPSDDELKVIAAIQTTYSFEQLKDLIKKKQLVKIIPVPSLRANQSGNSMKNHKEHGNLASSDKDTQLDESNVLKQQNISWPLNDLNITDIAEQLVDKSSVNNNLDNQFTKLDAMSFELLVTIYQYQGDDFDEINLDLLRKMPESQKRKVLDNFVKFMAHEAISNPDGLPF